MSVSEIVPYPIVDQSQGAGGGDQPDGGGPEDSGRRKAKEERDLRRLLIAEMLLAHMPYRTIAEHVGISKSQVEREVRKIRSGWRERTAHSYESHVDEEVAKIDALERAVLPYALATGAGFSLDAVDRALRLMDRRARLLGLDQPTKATLTVELPDLEAKKQRGRELLDEVARKRAQHTG